MAWYHCVRKHAIERRKAHNAGECGAFHLFLLRAWQSPALLRYVIEQNSKVTVMITQPSSSEPSPTPISSHAPTSGVIPKAALAFVSEPSEPSGRRPHKDKRATKTATPPPDSASDDSGDDDGERRYVRLSARGWPSSPIIERSTLLLANRKEERENLRYRPTLFLSALGVTLLLAAGMAFWQRARLEPLWSAVLANPEQAALAHLSLLVLLVGLPLGAGIALYALGWQCLRLLRITRYLG